jgi:hypothetical protein
MYYIFLIYNLSTSMDKIFEKYIKCNFDIIAIAVPIIDLCCPIKYSPNMKYDNKYFFTCLVDFVNTSVSWRKYKGCNNYPIDGKYLNSIHNKYIKNDVYEKINKAVLNKYLENGKEKKLTVQSIDASFISNKQGIHNLNDKPNSCNVSETKNTKKYENNINNQLIQYNRYNGRKKYFKISSITDRFGIPLGSTIITGKGNEINSIKETIDSIPINLNTKKNSTHNRFNQKMLADSGYSSTKNNKMLKKLGYTPLIYYNKRNTQNKNIIKKNKFNKKQMEIYKGRTIIESFFSWIKQFPVINQNYQKTITSYTGLLLLASSIIICNKI